MSHWVASAAIGFCAGALSGAFGIGGGVVTTPAIRLLMGAPALIAVGTPLPVIIPSAVTGAHAYVRRGFADVRAGVVIALAGAPAAILGAMGATRTGGTVVLIGTAALVLWAAIDTMLQARAAAAEDERSVDAGVEERSLAGTDDAPDKASARPALATLVVIGLVTGVYSGFFGLGGGFVLVPMLTRWGRLDIKRAIGTSLVAVAILAIPGTITHALLGNVDWRIAAGLVLGVIPGAAVGARLTLLAHDRLIRYAFAGLLFLVGSWLAYAELTGALR